MMSGVETLDFAHTFYGPFFQGVASDGIGRVGRVDDDAATVQHLDDAVEIAARVVLFVEFQYHGMCVVLYSIT